MGLLEQWDHRNQRILEWHNHLADEQRTTDPNLGYGITGRILLILLVALTIGRRVLVATVGSTPTIVVLTVVAVVVVTIEPRRLLARRRAWEASRETRT